LVSGAASDSGACGRPGGSQGEPERFHLQICTLRAVPGSSWPFLAASGCPWLLLVASASGSFLEFQGESGGCTLRAVPGSSWPFLAASGCPWLLLVASTSGSFLEFQGESGGAGAFPNANLYSEDCVWLLLASPCFSWPLPWVLWVPLRPPGTSWLSSREHWCPGGSICTVSTPHRISQVGLIKGPLIFHQFSLHFPCNFLHFLHSSLYFLIVLRIF
jgi:hypothetical protein